MGRLTKNSGNDIEAANNMEKMQLEPLNGAQEHAKMKAKTTDEKGEEPKPMTQIMEALFFASGGEYDSDDDTYDPFAGYVNEEGDASCSGMEDPDPTSPMGQAIPMGDPNWHPSPPVTPAQLPVPSKRKLNADISRVENDISDLQAKRSVLEGQMSNAREDKTILQQNAIAEQEIATKKAHLKRLKEEYSNMENVTKVATASRNYTRDKDMFVHSLFQKVKHERLDDVKMMMEALDKKGVNITDLVDDKTKYPLMHKALLENKQKTVEFLLKDTHGREMSKKAVKTKYCDALTPLYIALQQGKSQNVKLLLDVLTPEERTTYVNTKVHNKDYEKTFFNELPLVAALWSSVGCEDLTEISEIFKHLVENGAELDLQNAGGDTLLHLIVAQSSQSLQHLDYFRRFLKLTFTEAAGLWYNRKNQQSLSGKDAQVKGIRELFSKVNHDGFTPLTLAAQLESPLYTDLINWKDVMRISDAKRSQQFSNFDAYDVTNVISLGLFQGKELRYNSNSIMHVLAHNNVDITCTLSGQDISTLEPLKSIINQKWQFYQYIFYIWGFLHLVYMFVFTNVVFHFGPKNVPPIPPDVDEMPTSANSSNISSATAAKLLESGYYGPVKEGNPWYIFFVCLPITYIIFEIVDHCSVGICKQYARNMKCSITSIGSQVKGCISSIFHLTGNGVYRLIGFIFSIFTLIWIILHMMQNVNQDIILSIALLFGWLFTILFTRTINFPNRSSQIGAFSIMAQRMLFHDLFPFFVISIFIWLGFSSAIHATLLHSEETAKEETKFKHTVFNMLKYYVALDNGQDHKSSREKEFAKAVLSIYGITSVVLLINMLIAAMNKTYEMVRATRIDLVMRQRLAILLMLERRLPFQCLRERSEKFMTLETHNLKRLLGVVSMKHPGAVARNSHKSHEK